MKKTLRYIRVDRNAGWVLRLGFEDENGSEFTFFERLEPNENDLHTASKLAKIAGDIIGGEFKGG
jgi:hypothetical protein